MEETKWWSKLIVTTSVMSVVLLIAAPMGYKYGSSLLMSSLGTVMLALVLAFLVAALSLGLLLYVKKHQMLRDRKLLLIALAVSVIPMIAILPSVLKGTSVPPIHDISTDTQSPPIFHAIVTERLVGAKDESIVNDLAYGAGFDSPAVLAKLQQDAYPDIKTLELDTDVVSAVALTSKILENAGMAIVNIDPDLGIVEATATTFWFGFKDDVVVRIRPTRTGSKVDVRSVSRVGQSDLGANAARIKAILAGLAG
jgi:uncharacterized protein (DUF1499 family)